MVTDQQFSGKINVRNKETKKQRATEIRMTFKTEKSASQTLVYRKLRTERKVQSFEPQQKETKNAVEDS